MISRELTFGIGDTLTFAKARYNKERVYSLGLFNQVNFHPSKEDGKNIIEINVEESWYIYPIPFFAAEDGKLDKITAGMIVRIENFRGRNETLSALIALGYDPAFYLSYFNPNTIGDEKIFFAGTVGYSSINSKSIFAENAYGNQFEQKHIFTEFQVGKRFDVFQKLYVNFGYKYIETPEYVYGVNASNDRIDRFPSVGLGYLYDDRDLSLFPTYGIFVNPAISWKGLGFENINYAIANIDLRGYSAIIGNLFVKGRIKTRHSIGDLVPYYNYSILGFGDYIRGQGIKKMEGNHFYLTTIELFHPIIAERQVKLDFIPLVPKQLLSYRVALFIQAFAEAGAVQLHQKPISIRDFVPGYGFGLSLLILPYYVLRGEVAFDKYRNAELIFDIKVSF